MTLLHADFPSGQQGLYGSNVSYMLDGVWAEVSSANSRVKLVDDPDPNVTGQVLQFLNGSSMNNQYEYGDVARFVYPGGGVATSGVGFRLWMDALPSAAGDVNNFIFSDVNNVMQVSVVIGTTGILTANRIVSETPTLLGATSTPVIVANSWNHIEMKMTVSDTVGTLEIRVNGVAELALTGLDTKSTAETTTAQFNFNAGATSPAGTGPNMYVKDVIFWDTNGSVNNDFFGSVSVRDLYTDADVALNWTPSTGSTGWDLIDETTPNDADYISADDTPPAAYVASLTDLPADITSVRALLPFYRSAKTDGGDCNLQLSLTPNNVDWADGPDTPIPTGFTIG